MALETGRPVGLITSNARHASGKVIPSLNFAVPLSVLVPIAQHLRTGGNRSVAAPARRTKVLTLQRVDDVGTQRADLASLAPLEERDLVVDGLIGLRTSLALPSARAVRRHARELERLLPERAKL